MRAAILFVILAGIVTFTYQGCNFPTTSDSIHSKLIGSETGNPMQVNLAFDKLDGVDGSGKITTKISDNLEMSMCIRDLEFRKYNMPYGTYREGIDEWTIDQVGILNYSPLGTPIGMFNVTPMNYNNIQIEYAFYWEWPRISPCDFSLLVKNDQGDFSTTNTLTMDYWGDYTVIETGKNIILPISEFAEAMSEVNRSSRDDNCWWDPYNPNCRRCSQSDIDNGLCKTIERQFRAIGGDVYINR